MVNEVAAIRTDAPLASHGEGPVWNERDATIGWVDMLAGDQLSFDPVTGSSRRRNVSAVLAAFRPRVGGGEIAAIERGFALIDGDTDAVTPLPEIWADAGVRMNDGSCDTHGNFYCGSMAYDGAEGQGALYRITPAFEVDTVITGVTISNGLAFTADGSLAYYVDSPTQIIARVRLAEGVTAWESRETFVAIDETVGTPDGICLDSDGGVWVALWGGGAVLRFDATGTLTDRVTLPVSQVTACTIGGVELDTLFITTSALGIDPSIEPDAGALFSVPVTIAGVPALPFGV